MSETERVQNEERFRQAINLLAEARDVAFNSKGRVKEISVRIPLHGHKFGNPIQKIERTYN